jgi:hypothetical protein
MRISTTLLLLAVMVLNINADFELVEKSFLDNELADLDGNLVRFMQVGLQYIHTIRTQYQFART